MTQKAYTAEDIERFNRQSTNYVIGLTQNLSMAQTFATVWSREPFVSPKRKGILTGIVNRIRFCLDSAKDMVPPHQRDLMRAEVLDEEVVQQVVSVSTMMMALPKAERDRIEEYASGIYGAYESEKP